MFESCGKVNYRNNALVLDVNQDLGDYYSWFFKRETGLVLSKPLFGYHITIVSYKEKFIKMDLIKNEIKFSYKNTITVANSYVFIPVLDNEFFFEIRRKSQLKPYVNSGKPFHLSLGRIL